MKAAELHYLLRHPESLKHIERTVLDQMIREYPYFQTAYLLLAKKSNLDHEGNFEVKLNLAAAYAVDRVKLFEFINQKVIAGIPVEYADKEIKVVERREVTTTSDSELNELLQSIHERKQQVLDAAGKNGEEALVDDETDLFVSNELKVSASEFIPPVNQIAESEVDNHQEVPPTEVDVMKLLEHEMEEQEEYERGEEFLLLSELGGGGAEYLPSEELLDEETEAFAEERDPELQSISVIEEEFELHDLEIELKEKELSHVSESETSLQVETVNDAMMEITPDSELESVKNIEMELDEIEEYENQEELITVNEMGGGGSEFFPIEINEEEKESEPFQFISESDSVIALENVEESIVQDSNQIQIEQPSSFRINEHVESPGEFLPEKSYTFLEWLQFFRSEPSKEKKAKQQEQAVAEKIEEQKTGELIPEVKAENVTVRTGQQEELETIDRIVSSLKQEASQKPDHLFSPEQLAKKSIQMDEEILSETLAQIYEEQGKYDKAIRMYAKLSLKFPEKSLFFAARIKELKSKQ